MEQAGLGDCTVATETDDYGLILSSVRKIHGCFCMLESSSADLRNVGGLQPIAFAGELPDIAVRRAVRAPWRNDPVVIKLLSPLYEAFVAWMHQTGRQASSFSVTSCDSGDWDGMVYRRKILFG